VFVASVALLTIVILSEQLIARHLFKSSLSASLQDSDDFESYRVRSEDRLEFVAIEEWIGVVEPPSISSPQPSAVEKSSSAAQSTLVSDGVFWTDEALRVVAPGPSDFEVQAQMKVLRELGVSEVRDPDWLHCGRPQNRFIEFSDGSHACARYRDPHKELIQGEIMAFYLARLLGIKNTPTVVLSQVRTSRRRSLARHRDVAISASESFRRDSFLSSAERVVSEQVCFSLGLFVNYLSAIYSLQLGSEPGAKFEFPQRAAAAELKRLALSLLLTCRNL